MKIKKELIDYRDNVSKIISKKQQIEETLESRIELSGPSYDITGSRPKGFLQSSLEKQIIECDSKIDELNKEIAKIQRKLNVIDSLILTLDEEERIIIVGFFLEGKTNRKICREIDSYRNVSEENEKCTLEAIKKRKGRIIKKMQKRYENH